MIGIGSVVLIGAILIINKNKSASLGGRTQEEVDAEEIKKLVDAIDKAKK